MLEFIFNVTKDPERYRDPNLVRCYRPSRAEEAWSFALVGAGLRAGVKHWHTL